MKTPDLQRFLDAVSPNGGCPCCEKDEWTYIEPPQPDTAWSMPLIYKSGAAVMPAPAVPVIALVCTTCGFVRCHAEATVHHWLATNPEAS